MKKVGVLGIAALFLILLGYLSSAQPAQNHPWWQVLPSTNTLTTVSQGDGFVTSGNYSNGSIFLIDNTDNNSIFNTNSVALTAKVRSKYSSAIEAEAYAPASGTGGQVFGVKSEAVILGSSSAQAWGVYSYANAPQSWGVYGTAGTTLAQTCTEEAIGVYGFANPSTPAGIVAGVKGSVYKSLSVSNSTSYDALAQKYKAITAEGGSGIFITGPQSAIVPLPVPINYNKGAYAYSTVGDVYACSTNMTYEVNCTEVCRQHGNSTCAGVLFNGCVVMIENTYPPMPDGGDPVDGENKTLPPKPIVGYPIAITCWRNDASWIYNTTGWSSSKLRDYGIWNCDSPCQKLGRTEVGILACYCIPNYWP